jgi:hypothetical protein
MSHFVPTRSSAVVADSILTLWENIATPMSAQRQFRCRSAAVFGTLLTGAFVLLCATRFFATELPNVLVPVTVEVAQRFEQLHSITTVC